MKMTSEQRNLLTVLMNNKEVLEDLMKAASTHQKQAKVLQIKESITIAGITWSKFAEDSERNAYMLADEVIFNMKFGENNDWRESPIRNKLYDKLYFKIADELGMEAIVPIHTDLFSHDGLRDYGESEDAVSLLTYDLYRNNRESIKCIDGWWWTCTPDSTLSGGNSRCVQCIFSDGRVNCNCCDYDGVCVRFLFLNLISLYLTEVWRDSQKLGAA